MHIGPTLEVNLAAIARNYTLLRAKAGGKCAAVVKADAYGLGASEVAPVLYDTGCRDFFVATLEEGIRLRAEFDEDIEPRAVLGEPRIFIFHGCRKGQAKDFTHHRLTPVLNSLEQLSHWNDAGPYALHIDTGMSRLGLSLKAAAELPPANRNLQLVMSHLACANEPENPMNRKQAEDFGAAVARFPKVAASLANSSGIFLGKDFHIDLARPGCSLYGITPNASKPNPMENVVELSAPVLQYRVADTAQPVGYGATAEAKAGSVLATVEMGYADGFLRSLSGKASGIAAGVRVPLMGRVSMDMLIFDVSAVPESKRTADLRITLIGRELPVDEVAKAAGTIGYEVFTRLGARVKRVYMHEA